MQFIVICRYILKNAFFRAKSHRRINVLQRIIPILFYYFRRKQKEEKTGGFGHITRVKEVLVLPLTSHHSLLYNDIFLKAKRFVLSLKRDLFKGNTCMHFNPPSLKLQSSNLMSNRHLIMGRSYLCGHFSFSRLSFLMASDFMGVHRCFRF